MGTVASLPAAGLGMAQPQPCGKDEEMALCGAELLFQGNGGWWRGMEANGADPGGKGVAASIWLIEGNGGQQRGMEVSGANGGEWRGRCGQWSGMEAKGAYPGENGAFWRHSGISVILFRIGFLCIFFFTLPAVLILLLCAAVGIKAPVAYRRGSGTCPHLSLCLTGAPNPALSLGKNPWPLTRPQHWNCLMAHGDVVALWWQRDQGGKPSAVGIC